MLPKISLFCHLFVAISAIFKIIVHSEEYLPQSILDRGELISHRSFTPQNKSVQIDPCSEEPETTPINKNVIIGEHYKWYKTKCGHYAIPVYIDPEYDARAVNQIIEGMYAIQEPTCIHFYLYKDPSLLKGLDWIHVLKDDGCYSHIGRQRKGNQSLSLTDFCLNHHPFIIHEFLHAVGFYHEHTRADRDEHVIVNWENIKSGKERNFIKLDPLKYTTYGAEYDTNSIMHYCEKVFSSNGLPTIISRNGEPLGRSTELSYWDIYKINKMYICQF